MVKVRVGAKYVFKPVGVDAWHPVHQGLKSGEVVKVVNLPGAPKANTMGHCYVDTLDGKFGGLVLTASLQKVSHA